MHGLKRGLRAQSYKFHSFCFHPPPSAPRRATPPAPRPPAAAHPPVEAAGPPPFHSNLRTAPGGQGRGRGRAAPDGGPRKSGVALIFYARLIYRHRHCNRSLRQSPTPHPPFFSFWLGRRRRPVAYRDLLKPPLALDADPAAEGRAPGPWQ